MLGVWEHVHWDGLGQSEWPSRSLLGARTTQPVCVEGGGEGERGVAQVAQTYHVSMLCFKSVANVCNQQNCVCMCVCVCVRVYVCMCVCLTTHPTKLATVLLFSGLQARNTKRFRPSHFRMALIT